MCPQCDNVEKTQTAEHLTLPRTGSRTPALVANGKHSSNFLSSSKNRQHYVKPQTHGSDAKEFRHFTGMPNAN